MSAFETLIYEKEDALALVTLNRPQFLNAYNIQMRDDLFEVLNAIRDDDEVRVALLQGVGEKAFCAGADLSEFLTAPPPVTARQIRFDRDVWELFLSIPSDNAQFGLPEVALGIIPAAGGTQTLPRAVGRAGALEMLLTGRWMDAREALQIKLVNRVVPADRLLETARGMAKKIATYDPDVIKGIKQAVVRGMDLPLASGLDLEKTLACQRGAGTKVIKIHL
jgi:enoyl-CoA hydratase/carnithine racemase